MNRVVFPFQNVDGNCIAFGFWCHIHIACYEPYSSFMEKEKSS